MEMKNATWESIKKGAIFICSVGAGLIGGNIVKATTPASIGILSKICIGAGGVAISGMMADNAAEYVEKKLDEVVIEVGTPVSEEPKQEVVSE